MPLRISIFSINIAQVSEIHEQFQRPFSFVNLVSVGILVFCLFIANVRLCFNSVKNASFKNFKTVLMI